MPANTSIPGQIPGLGLYTGGGSPTPGVGGISSILNSAIPGFSGLTKSATGNIMDLLGGDPSPSIARRANAYFGANSGMPGSEFVRNRGFDLYNQQGEQRKETGLHDLLSLLAGYSGNAFPTVGEQQQGNQFSQDLDFRKAQANNALLQGGGQPQPQGQNPLFRTRYGLGPSVQAGGTAPITLI